jgi:hypothetical protein
MIDGGWGSGVDAAKLPFKSWNRFRVALDQGDPVAYQYLHDHYADRLSWLLWGYKAKPFKGHSEDMVAEAIYTLTPDLIKAIRAGKAGSWEDLDEAAKAYLNAVRRRYEAEKKRVDLPSRDPDDQEQEELAAPVRSDSVVRAAEGELRGVVEKLGALAWSMIDGAVADRRRRNALRLTLVECSSMLITYTRARQPDIRIEALERLARQRRNRILANINRGAEKLLSRFKEFVDLLPPHIQIHLPDAPEKDEHRQVPGADGQAARRRRGRRRPR